MGSLPPTGALGIDRAAVLDRHGSRMVLGAGAVVLLAHFGRYALIPQFLGVIMELHFLPLERLLRAPR
jgi:hypothetical protein